MMISIQIENTVYATNNDLTGFFSRRENEGAYKQHRGNSDMFFATENEFRKYAKAVHAEAGKFLEDREKTPDVTRGGKFVWRAAR